MNTQNFALKQQSPYRHIFLLALALFSVCVVFFACLFQLKTNKWMKWSSFDFINRCLILFFFVVSHLNFRALDVSCVWLYHFVMRAIWVCIFSYSEWKCVFSHNKKSRHICHLCWFDRALATRWHQCDFLLNEQMTFEYCVCFFFDSSIEDSTKFWQFILVWFVVSVGRQ